MHNSETTQLLITQRHVHAFIINEKRSYCGEGDFGGKNIYRFRKAPLFKPLGVKSTLCSNIIYTGITS